MACSHLSRPPAASRFVPRKRWSENWESVQEYLGGGQGEAKRVSRKSDGQVGFLKAIRMRNDPERRRRFFREATAYDTMESWGIPRLVESNAHLHNDPQAVPYIVTEFVEGPTLHQWRQPQSMVDLEIAVRTTRELLAILTMCHASGFVHRDVKPDNIILAECDPGRPVLLDFGLSFHKPTKNDLETEQGQELGNRFLRLPELSAGSSLKQDPRSDISFAAGILFFLLTGQHPNVLQDAEGRLPHQRSQVLETLERVAGSSFHRLLGLFDRAFAHVATAAPILGAGLSLSHLSEFPGPPHCSTSVSASTSLRKMTSKPSRDRNSATVSCACRNSRRAVPSNKTHGRTSRLLPVFSSFC